MSPTGDARRGVGLLQALPAMRRFESGTPGRIGVEAVLVAPRG